MKKILESSAGKRAMKILGASADPVEDVTRATEIVVEANVVGADTINIESLFSPTKSPHKGKGKGKSKRKRSLADVLNASGSRPPPKLDLFGAVGRSSGATKQTPAKRARFAEADSQQVKMILHFCDGLSRFSE